MISAYATILGPISGFLLARYIPDETQWYPTYFFWSALALMLASAFYTSNVWLGFMLAGALIYAFSEQTTWLFALAAGLLAARASLTGQQLLLVALIPATGYLYHHGQRKQLYWYALMPIVITLAALL